MLDITAKTVYVDPEVRRKSNCLDRLDRMLPHVRCDDIRRYDDAAREAVSTIKQRRHGRDDFGDEAVLVFTTFQPRRMEWYFHQRDEAQMHGGVCQPALELNLVDGCVFRCAYCGFGRRIIFSLDVEGFMANLGDVFARHPRQRLYKFSNMTDLPPFEPELNAIPPMVERFALEENRYLMLFTKSHNVDFLRDLDHRGRTIISWSVTCDTASRLIDKRAATMHERIEAMRDMQACGYRVRARLSPIVPIRNWRREYAELLELLFRKASPDMVTLELLGWMDFDDLATVFDSEVLDPCAMRAAREAAGELRGVHWGPFTQRTHEEIYRFCIETVRRLSPRTPVSVCHGTPATWGSVGDLTGMRPDDYICNCGPQSAPGGQTYDKWHPAAPLADSPDRLLL